MKLDTKCIHYPNYPLYPDRMYHCHIYNLFALFDLIFISNYSPSLSLINFTFNIVFFNLTYWIHPNSLDFIPFMNPALSYQTRTNPPK